ncbi:MAG: hypothetical protein M3O85_08375 [Acidobacteriota bacterium]|nr:hypothetical protein [Acidobacteriota bacterium]
MRWSRLPVLLLMGASCLAQIPDRKELTGNPKFVEESPKPSFRTFTEAQLRAEIKITSTRSYAVFGYNTPEVRVNLPKVSNSAYSKIEFGPATLVGATGQKLPFELEESGYMDEECASEIRFQTGNPEKLIQFAHARGQVKVKYPLAVKTATITPTQAGPPELAVKIDGPYVNFAQNEEKTPPPSFHLRPLRAYDAQGRQLEQHSNSEISSDDNGVDITHTAFYGNVARVEIDTVDSWAELDLPYNLTPAPLLPKGHEGEAPEAPPQ